MRVKNRTIKRKCLDPISFGRYSLPHSRQAYCIIKTIHLMNFANADTLAPSCRYGALKQERWEFLFVLIQQIQNKTRNTKTFLSGKQSGWKNLSGAGRATGGLHCD